MLKVSEFLALILLFSTLAHGADFRNADFGMTKEQVKATEQAEPDVETETQLIYRNVEVGGLSADAKYFFSDDWLRRGDYRFHPFQMMGHYSDAFNRLSAWITERHGQPSDELYVQPSGKKAHTQKFGEVDAQVAIAMMLGSAANVLARDWRTEEKIIALLMSGAGNGEEEVKLTMVTESRHKAPIQQLKTEKASPQGKGRRELGRRSESEPSPDTLETPEPAIPQPSEESTGGWEVSISESEFDDSPTVALALEADQPIQGWLRQATPSLIVRCKEGRTEAYINVGMQPASAYRQTRELNTAVIRVRFDEGKTRGLIVDESNSNKAVFFRKPKSEIRKMLSSERMTFGFTPYNSSPVSTRFELAGLPEAIEPLREACGW